jgi:thiol-disulfide isomerase/thioredoxin
VNWEGLTQQPYAEWFKPNYLDYQVDAASLAAIDDKINDVEIVVFMGTWCEDSQLQVPQFYKILDHLGYDLHKMRVVAIDREEEGLIITPEAAEYKIEFVPTFIFYRNGKELGRISEYPVKTIEKDMVAILTK